MNIEINRHGSLLFVVQGTEDKACFTLDEMNAAEQFAAVLVHDAYKEHKRQQAIFRKGPSTFNSFVLNICPELWSKLCA